VTAEDGRILVNIAGHVPDSPLPFGKHKFSVHSIVGRESTAEQVASLRLTATRADQAVPTLTTAYIDRIAPHELARRCRRLRPVAIDARHGITYEQLPTSV
jgi:hypothetical protein